MSVLRDDARARYFDCLPLPLWAVDADDRTVDVNPAVVAALGYPIEELLGRSPADFLTEESRATYRAQSILRRSGLADTFYCTFHAKGGGTRVFRVSGSPVFDGETYVGKIAVLRDVADWNAIERDPNPSGFGRAAGDLAHDLRHSLEEIAGFAALLLQGTPGPLRPEQATQAQRIADAARAALDRLRQFDA